MKMIIPVIALALAGVSAPALAQSDSALSSADFATVDSDRSGEVSYNELLLVLPDFEQTRFDELDLDKSGGLNEAEYAAIAPASVDNAIVPAPAADGEGSTAE